jgi:N-acylglucosamine-6-phosphate 2-epimerase
MTVERLNIPVFGEGRVNSAIDVKKMKDMGVYGVVVGSAITRPRIITQRFAKAFNNDEF